MPTECNPALFDFAPVKTARSLRHSTVAASPPAAGALLLLLGAADRVIGLTRRFAACFKDSATATSLNTACRRW